jgi:hypothetical protein
MLIDINPVAPAALRSQRRGFVEIGAMTRWRDLEVSAEIAQISRLSLRRPMPLPDCLMRRSEGGVRLQSWGWPSRRRCCVLERV